MITFLASPKPFKGAAYNNQINAIRSWLNVHPNVEIILFGNSPGCAEASLSLGVKNVPAIASSPSGVPYFEAIVSYAQKHALYDIQIYLNSDIVVDSHILNALKLVSFSKFLILGQRIDLPDGAVIPPEKDSWDAYLKALVQNGAILHTPPGMDYFIFPRGLWVGLEPLVIGRAGYDNALVSFCLKKDIPIIDATYAIPALHQYHDYSHVAGKEKEVLNGEDARRNSDIHGVEHSAPNTADATWQIYNNKLIRNNSRGNRFRDLEIYLRYRRKMVFLGYVVRAVWRVLAAVGICRTSEIKLIDVIPQVLSKY